MNIIDKLLNCALTNICVQIVLICIILDTVLGVARAIKYKKFNSSAGIDGAIRKVTMLICLIFLMVIDIIVQINFIGFLPNDLIEVLPIKRIGITEFFSILYILYEAVSILKNMALCGLPMPKKLRNVILKFLNEMTDEVDDGGNKNDKSK